LKKLKFFEGPLPKGFKFDFESFLFNEERHRHAQSGGDLRWVTFYLLRTEGKKIVAVIHFFVSDGIALSPFKAPFGSVEFSKKIVAKDLFEFLGNVEEALKSKGVDAIRIKNPPASYGQASSSLLEVLLLNLGYRVDNAEINTAIAVNKTKYDQKVEAWEIRKLRQAEKAKLKFKEVPISLLGEIYEFIHSCRIERNQSLSMILPELMNVANACSGSISLFGVYQQAELAAASISIRVNERILYNFYSAHPRKFDELSPVVILIQGIYGWSQKQDVELIDLGTSALDGLPNFGLLDFKLRLGGQPSTKFCFVKELR
jgi:hypothetical protein